MRKIVFSLVLALMTVPLQAASTLQSYAYQAQLGDASPGLQRVILPLDVVLQLTRSDLGDLAVFNATGKMLPHAVAPTSQTSLQQVMILPFHEFSRFQRERSRTITRRQQNQQDGSVSELQTIETVPVQTRRNAFLVELKPAQDTPEFDRIELQWMHAPASQWLELRVESGNQLDSLRVIHPAKSLTNLESKDIAWRSISGLPRQQKYLRLTPGDSVETFELREVNGIYREFQPAPKHGHLLTPDLVEEDDQRYYSFTFPSRVRAEAIRIIPGDERSVVSGDLYATWGNLQDKRSIHGRFRQHNINDDEVAPSEPIKLRQRDLKRVWFTSVAELDAPPRVELIYPQYEVVYLGDGNGPYRLAWGNYAVEPGRPDLRSLLDGSLQDALERGILVTLGEVETAGGPSRLAAQPSLPWQKWLLWSLLVLAAFITGRMAWRLYREMNGGEQTRES